MQSSKFNVSELSTRIYSGLILAAVALMALLAGGIFFSIFCAVVGAITVWEITNLSDPKISRKLAIVLGAMAGVISLTSLLLNLETIINFSLSLIIPVTGALVLRAGRIKFFGFCLLILMSVKILATIRLELGTLSTLWLILVVVFSDIFAYFVGKGLGGPKVVSTISPNKTWSGAIGGCAGAALISYGFQFITPSTLIIVIGIIVSIFAQIGDFSESWLKRKVGAKDSSSLLPGHGGFFDRFDGMAGGCIGYWAILEFGQFVGIESVQLF